MKISIAQQSERVRKQTGVIPYRINKDGSIEVLLISSTHAEKWGFPKGKKEKHLRKKESAQVEAWEEAGVKGKLGKRLGVIEYRKGSTGVKQHVIFYPMLVLKEYSIYPESWRKRKWFSIRKAVSKLDRKQVTLLLKLEEKI